MASSKGTSQVVDFTNVTEGSDIRPTRVPAGDYLATIVDVIDSPSKKDNVFQWRYTIQLKGHSGTYPYYCKLQDNQLWKLRNLFVAAGKNVPKKRVKLDPNLVIGKAIGVTMEDDEYNDKLKSNVAAVFPASDLEDEVVDAEDDDTEDEEEEYEDEAPAEDEVDEDEEEDEEEEPEPEPEPAPRRRPAKKAAPTKKAAPAKKAPARRAKPSAVTDDELEELDIDEV